MRLLPTLLFFAAMCSSVPSWAGDDVVFDASASILENEQIAFVGEVIFERLDKTYEKPVSGCTENADGSRTCSMVLHPKDKYKTRYRVMRDVSGHLSEPFVDFYSFGEYGPPNMKEKPVPELVFLSALKNDNGGFDLVGESFGQERAFRTTDGDWAVCGNHQHQRHSNPDYRPPLMRLPFLNSARVNVNEMYRKHDEDGDGIISEKEAKRSKNVDRRNLLINARYVEPIWERDGDYAVCKAGSRVDDLRAFELRMFKKERRRVICNLEMGESPNIIVGPGFSPSTKETGVLHKICTDRLEFQNLP